MFYYRSNLGNQSKALCPSLLVWELYPLLTAFRGNSLSNCCEMEPTPLPNPTPSQLCPTWLFLIQNEKKAGHTLYDTFWTWILMIISAFNDTLYTDSSCFWTQMFGDGCYSLSGTASGKCYSSNGFGFFFIYNYIQSNVWFVPDM